VPARPEKTQLLEVSNFFADFNRATADATSGTAIEPVVLLP